MNKREDFEARFTALASMQVAYASEEDGQTEVESAEEQRLLKETLERLNTDPSLFSGDPNGYFTYEDPVLALAALYDRLSPEIFSHLGYAGLDGEELRNDSYFRWIRTAVHAVIARGDRSYVLLSGRIPKNPIRFGGEKLRIAVVGDAGYKGYAQARVLREIRESHIKQEFDFILHLGDTYFSGSPGEIFLNFLGPYSTIGPPVFTLLGNHDLYYGADGFSNALDVLRQPGRYFSIETPHWIIACLDTALPADTLRRNEGLLDEGQLSWLDDILHNPDGKRVILMSHHYTVSAWEKVSSELNLQLRDRIRDSGRVISWYWGHEHGCATYDADSAGFYGACVGNGSFLELYREPGFTPQPSWYAQGRCNCYGDEASEFWPHGFLELEILPNKITETYHLENGETHSRDLPVNVSST